MDHRQILLDELKGSVDFFLHFTNLQTNSPGFGLTVDLNKKPHLASIASTGYALTAWVIGAERGFISRERAREITRQTLDTLLDHASHYHGFFAHFMDIGTGERFKKCEYSTIDTAICINGAITAAAYFHDSEISQKTHQLLERVDWPLIIFEENDKTLFRMAYNPDAQGDYVHNKTGFISQWDMAAEQKMMYLQAAGYIDAGVARKLYAGFHRDKGIYTGQEVIIHPGGGLYVYQCSEAWLDVGRYLDPHGVDWFRNTRLAALANRAFCLEHSDRFKTYHETSWGLSAGDSPHGYAVFGGSPSLWNPYHDGTVSIWGGSRLPAIYPRGNHCVGRVPLYVSSSNLGGIRFL